MCTPESDSAPARPVRLWRNGLDYVPPKTYPPDYSNVPSVRDWQMSPFGNDRFDLDEQQRWEKKGYKGQMQLALLQKQAEEQEAAAADATQECRKCQERDRMIFQGPPYLPPELQRCVPRYLYRPYGPPPVPLPAYPPTRDKFAMPHTYHVPGLQPSKCVTCSTPERLPPVEYPESFILNRCPNYLAGYEYVPYGPTAETKIHPDVYKPYGPSTLRTIHAHL